MNKFIITFGSGQLVDFNVRPNDVALIIEADNEGEARQRAVDFEGIGLKFCTSYPYNYMEEFRTKYNMQEFTLNQLNKYRR